MFFRLRAFALVGWLIAAGVCAEPVRLETHADLLEKVKSYRAVVLFIGHGAKGQYKDIAAAQKNVDAVAQRFNEIYGNGRWLAVFGGDSFNAEKPDIAHILKYVRDKYHAPLLAIQSDIVIPWGGVDPHVNFVHYIPTDQAPALDSAGQAIIENGKPKMTTFWGGFVNGEAKGPTKVYLGSDFVEGPPPLLKEVVAVGSGPIGKDEALFAREKKIPLTVIRAETKYPEVNGKYGPLDDWVRTELGEDLGAGAITFTSRQRLGDTHQTNFEGDFLAPNERHPADARAVFAKAKSGVLAGPGSERMLFDAVLAPQATHVLALDVDPNIVRFHRVNTALLKAAGVDQIEEYRDLRLNSDAAVWKRASANPLLTELEGKLLQNPDVLAWWQAYVRQSRQGSNRTWNAFYKPPVGPQSPFYGVNYLYEPAAFRRVQTLAREGRIEARHIDLGNVEAVGQLVQDLRERGLRLSALDLSNAWQSEYPNMYMGGYRTGNLLREFDKVADKGSLFVATKGYVRHRMLRPVILYQARTYGQLRKAAEHVSDWSGEVYGFEGALQEIEHDFRAMEEGKTVVNSCFARAIGKAR